MTPLPKHICCPFCKSPEIREGIQFESDGSCVVFCSKCGARVPGKTPKEATTAWDTRATDELVEAAGEYIEYEFSKGAETEREELEFLHGKHALRLVDALAKLQKKQ